MKKDESMQHIGIFATKERVRMDYMADDFAITDDMDSLQFFDFPIRAADFVFGVCYRGEMEVEIDLKRYFLKPDGIMAIFPGQVVRIVSCNKEFTACFAAMSSTFISRVDIGINEKLPMFLYVKENPVTSLYRENTLILKGYFSILRNKIRTVDSENRQNILLHLMQALFYEGMDTFNKFKPREKIEQSRKQEIFTSFNQLVEQHFSKERKVLFYAGKLSLTSKYLSSVVKEVSGKPANGWIDDYVMQEAKLLLKTSDLTVLQISEALHFSTPSHFGAYFSKHAGISPNRYRKG